MNIAICDDNAADGEVIYGYIKSYCEMNCFMCDIQRFESGEELLSHFVPGLFHIIFLDIYLTGISGMDTAKIIREADPNCTLIFITVSSDHALDAFSVQADSYLVKPVDEEKMTKTLALCRQEFLKYSRYIEVTANYQSQRIPLVNIQYVEVFGKVTLLHLDTSIVKTYMPLDEIERKLGGIPFLRCHRCYIVNMNYVDDLREQSFLMRNGDSVPIRKNGRAEVKLTMARFMTGSALRRESS